jgi:hypothetical protein
MQVEVGLIIAIASLATAVLVQLVGWIIQVALKGRNGLPAIDFTIVQATLATQAATLAIMATSLNRVEEKIDRHIEFHTHIP